MGITTKIFLSFLASLLLISSAFAEQPLEARVADILQRLAKGDFAERERAEAELLKLPAESLPFLEKAIKSEQTILDVRLTIERFAGELRQAERSRKSVAELTKSTVDFAARLQAQYDAKGHRGKWDEAVHEGIQRRYMTTAELWGRPALRRAKKAFEQAIDEGCDDPLVKYLQYLTLKDLSEIEDPVAQIGAVPDELAKRKYPAPLVAQAFANRGEEKWLLLQRAQPDAARRASAGDLARALSEYAAADPKDFASIEDQVYCGQYLATLIARSDPSAVAERVAGLLKQVAPSDRVDPVAIAVRLRSLNSADLAINETRKDTNTPRLKDVQEAYEQALKAASSPAYTDDITVLRARFRVAFSRRQADETGRLLESLMKIDPRSIDLIDEQCDLLGRVKDYDAMLQLATVAAATDSLTTHVRLQYANIHWDIGFLRDQDAAGHIAEPEVWKGITRVFEAHLRHFPNDRTAHAHFAWYAYRAGDYERAKRSFDAAGDDGDDPTTPSMTDYDYYRQKTDAAVAVQ